MLNPHHYLLSMSLYSFPYKSKFYFAIICLLFLDQYLLPSNYVLIWTSIRKEWDQEQPTEPITLET